ncbi:hypothetical protein C0Q70_20487 [Pomacea canaliculata]|uniref:Uncharacterized protein n=1 Tax=Pomacea canaliculata TaxID=400727 RepID=A0A2T7NFP0_POMCA|nr:hypothetical protein C0Q70_20487 [Pomacea canaliculata]
MVDRWFVASEISHKLPPPRFPSRLPRLDPPLSGPLVCRCVRPTSQPPALHAAKVVSLRHRKRESKLVNFRKTWRVTPAAPPR